MSSIFKLKKHIMEKSLKGAKMSKRIIKQYDSDFKVKVVLEAIKEE